MHVPSSAQLLDLCDAGRHALPIERARLLLRAAWPEHEPIDSWPLGLANARLLELRAAMFEPKWQCLATCPQCGVAAEVVLDLPEMVRASREVLPCQSDVSRELMPGQSGVSRELMAGQSGVSREVMAGQSGVSRKVSGGDWSVAFRIPTVGDVLSTVQRRRSGEQLLETLILSAASGGRALAAGELTDEMRAAVDGSVSKADPLATIDVLVQCPSCTNQWRECLDVIALLWTEICAAARSLVSEVAQLAVAFGWSEPEVLALPALRRQQYLELVRAQYGAI